MIRIFNQSETDQIIKDYQSGMTLRETAEKHFASSITILNYLKYKGIARRDRHDRRKQP